MFDSRPLADELIVQKMKEGDQKMLTLLYKRNTEPVRNYIMRNNGTTADVEDMLQEALVVLWQNVQKADFILSSKIDTYIYAVAKNLWLKQLRKNGRITNSEMDNDHTLGLQDESNFAAEEADDQVQVLSKYLKQLSDACRQLLSLFYFEQWDMDQIATRLRFANAQTAKAKKYQCKKRLEELIKQHYTAEDLL